MSPLAFHEVQVSHSFRQSGSIDLGAIRQNNHSQTVIRKALNGVPKPDRLAIMSVAAMPAIRIEKPSKTIKRRKAAVPLLQRSAVRRRLRGQCRLHFFGG